MAQTMKIEEIGSVLGALPKAAPTYAVLGNHDHVNHLGETGLFTMAGHPIRKTLEQMQPPISLENPHERPKRSLNLLMHGRLPACWESKPAST